LTKLKYVFLIMALLASTLPAGTKYATPQELLNLFAENLSVPLSDTSIIVIGNSAPTDVNKVWVDTSGANPVLKIYNGQWIAVGATTNFTTGLTVTGGNVRLLTNSLSIDNTGAYANRVGVGTTTPATALEVVGAITASTSLTAGSLALTAATTANTATAGSNGDVPAQVAGYLTVLINGTNRKIPYYNA
jgi:hypothetical protein